MNPYEVYETIIISDYFTAWEHWVEHPHDDPGARLMQYLGENSLNANTPKGIQMSQEAAHKLRLLLGPHHQTIIKAWYAKHGS